MLDYRWSLVIHFRFHVWTFGHAAWARSREIMLVHKSIYRYHNHDLSESKVFVQTNNEVVIANLKLFDRRNPRKLYCSSWRSNNSTEAIEWIVTTPENISSLGHTTKSYRPSIKIHWRSTSTQRRIPSIEREREGTRRKRGFDTWMGPAFSVGLKS